MKLCGFEIGLQQPFFLIAGPCVIESEQLQMDTAGTLKEITSSLGIPFIFKSSFDKANRSSGSTFRGPGIDKGLEILAKDFDERDPAVKALLSLAIAACKRQGKYVGICGQGPSDHADFALWLKDQGIGSMSLNPDTVIETWKRLAS